MADVPRDTRAVCVGSGRFLRAVLVPFLQRASGGDGGVALFQPRGEGFADACTAAGLHYEVDTIHRDGRVATEAVQLAGVGALARDADRRVFLALPQKLPMLRFVGVGVTDAGFVPGSAVMRDLAQFLFACHTHLPDNVLSVINTDNVPANGELLRTRVLEAEWPTCPPRDSSAWAAFVAYLVGRVHFHNTMVDRLTSHRADDTLVPLAEPWPTKVLAIQDSAGVLDKRLLETQTVPGVLVRATREELLRDQKLKLRVANGTSSALVYVLALSRFKTNNEARLLPDMLAYRDELFTRDILPSLEREGVARETALQVYDEWTHRSSHAHFGLVNLWVTQNAWLHFGARLFPSLRANVEADDAYRASAAMVFATASILRFLTPMAGGGGTETTIKARPTSTVESMTSGRAVFIGAMDARTRNTPTYPELASAGGDDLVYGSGLRANLTAGEYEFVDAPHTNVAARLGPVADVLKTHLRQTEEDAVVLVRTVVGDILSSVEGYDSSKPGYAQFAHDVSAIYARLVRGRLENTESAMDVLHHIVAGDH